jgi:signal peptidase I
MASRRRRWLAAIVVPPVLTLVVMVVLFDTYLVSTDRMAPTLQRGERVLSRPLTGDRVGRGDIVVYVPPAAEAPATRVWISRVVGLEGDLLATEEGRVMVNGRTLDEAYLPGGTATHDLTPIEVPAGHVYVLSDNRGEARDSRHFGPIAHHDVYGRVVIRWWPLGALGGG